MDSNRQKEADISLTSDNGTIDMLQLDPEGDVILHVKNSATGAEGKFLVASKVLGLASKMFAKMFSPSFKEGRQLREEVRPCITLEEDDPTAMETILRVLHYKHESIPFTMNAKTLSTLAVHIDKYQCHQTLAPWTRHWCASFKDVTSSKDIGFFLLAAYLLWFPSLPVLMAHAVKHLPPGFLAAWWEEETLHYLPDTLTGSQPDLIQHIVTNDR
ncbi:putative BTB domain-containing protein [Seiridium cardinale]|uniref:BTB domain-containing protein n=1 Tax=Seiridium cardinale TaxID=138064 RepID=A0ABR2Y3M3_9PEZI